MSEESPYRSPQAYESPSDDGPRPQVVMWFRVYTAVMVCLQLLVAVVGVAFFIFADELAADDPTMSAIETRIMGGMYTVAGLVIGAALSVSLFVPRKKWGWIYALVVICLGLPSCCSMPFAIALLIYWLKPETKAYFHV